MATKKSKPKASERPAVVFNKKGNLRVAAAGISACVWHSHVTDEWKWETRVSGATFRFGRAGTRAQAEGAAVRAIPALARLALRMAGNRAARDAKTAARSSAEHNKMAAALAPWVR